jgi:hypothetical protein
MIETLGGGRDDEQHGRLAKPGPIHDTELSERQQKSSDESAENAGGRGYV